MYGMVICMENAWNSHTCNTRRTSMIAHIGTYVHYSPTINLRTKRCRIPVKTTCIVHSYKLYQDFYNTAMVLMVLLSYNFIYAWCHTVFHMLIAKVCHGIYISTRRDMALPQVVFTRDMEFTCNVEFTCNMEFTCDRNVIFSWDPVVLTKLSNWQDSSCL